MGLRRDSLLVLGLFTTLCLLTGLIIGIQSNKLTVGALVASPTAPRNAAPGATATDAAFTPAPLLQPIVSGRQMAVLIVGVTDANDLQPKFEGCWIIAFTPGIYKYYVLGFPPESKFQITSLGSNTTLADIYSQDVQQEVGYRFMRDAIQSVVPALTIQAEVTLDRAALADLASKVGSVPVGGQELLGSRLAAAYDTQSFNGIAARMEFQHQAFAALFQALADQHWTPGSVARYLEMVPRAVRVEDLPALLQLADSAPPLQNSELTWIAAGANHDRATVP